MNEDYVWYKIATSVHKYDYEKKMIILVKEGFDGNQGGPSFKDPLQVSDGPITRSKAKKIKEAMQGFVQSTLDEASKSPTLKMGLKEGEPVLIHLIQAVKT